jgi:hypothetical protein
MYTYYICTYNAKYMIKHTYSVVTNETTREKIWKLMAEVDRWSTWDPSLEYAKLEGKFQTGSRFQIRPIGGPKVNITLEEVRAEQYFRDITKFPLAKMYGEHWYEETPEGLKITITMTMKGILAPLWNKIVMSNIVKGLESDVAMQIRESMNV